MTTNTLWLFNGCLFAFLFAIAAVFKFRRWNEKHAGRVPVAEKLLRSPGESLQRRLESLSDNLADAMVFATALPAITLAVGIGGVPGRSLNSLTAAILGTFALTIFAFFLARLIRTADEMRKCRLGLLGERAAGEEINQLMRHGCHVFHDVPMEPYGNIDHVIVAPSGVFAVETKTCRKRKAKDGKREHEVVFDGKALEFPQWRDTASLEQARQQADRLRVMLTKAVGEAVPVVPVLTLPGWFVTSRVNVELKVVNPKQIGTVVLNRRGEKLAPELIERIAYQLERECRDVEM